MTCKSEKRVKNEDAGTLINKNVISPHPTPPPHHIPPPRTNPGMPTRNYHRKRVTKHSKKRRKCNGAQENSVERGMKWMLRKWRKHEKTTTLRDALAGPYHKQLQYSIWGWFIIGFATLDGSCIFSLHQVALPSTKLYNIDPENRQKNVETNLSTPIWQGLCYWGCFSPGSG